MKTLLRLLALISGIVLAQFWVATSPVSAAETGHFSVSWEGYLWPAEKFGAKVLGQVNLCALTSRSPLQSECIVIFNFGNFKAYKKLISMKPSDFQTASFSERTLSRYQTALERKSGKSGKAFFLQFILKDRAGPKVFTGFKITGPLKSIPGYLASVSSDLSKMIQGEVSKSSPFDVQFEAPGGFKARTVVRFNYAQK